MSQRTTRNTMRKESNPTNRFQPKLERFEDRALLSTCTVINLGDTGAGTLFQGDLRYCLNLANSNKEADRIEFAPELSGAIAVEMGSFAILESVEIDGPGPAQLTIDAQLKSGIFRVPQEAGAIDVTIRQLTLTRGIGVPHPPWREGGALFNYMGNVMLDEVIVTGNVIIDQASSSGGGIQNLFGTMLLQSCVVSDNMVGAGGVGGGIDNVGGTMTLIDTVVSGNRAKNFAGISNRGTLTVIRGEIVENVAQESGGGIHTLGTLTVIESNLSNNIAPGGGAGIYNVSGTVSVRDSTIANNRGTGIHTSGWTDISGSTIAHNHGLQGGGFYVYGGTLRITNSTISGNVSENKGGAINIVSFELVPESIVQLTATTITGNEARHGVFGRGGGGIEIIERSGVNARVVMNSCLIAGNTTHGMGPDVHGVVVSLGYNFIGLGKDSTGWVANDRVGVVGALLDPKLGPLGDYGGKTLTHALSADSPAIRAGDPGLSGLHDQRGTWRQPYFNPDPGAFQSSEALNFKWVAPAVVIKGQPFLAKLLAVDADGNHAVFFVFTIHFTSSDPSAQLPEDYTFSNADLGSQTFQFTLNTVGRQALRVKDLDGFPRGFTSVDVNDGMASTNNPNLDIRLDDFEQPFGRRRRGRNR